MTARHIQTASPTERARRTIVALALLFYVLLIFEGALRKWLLPAHGQALFFVRDPVVIAIYVLALRGRYFPRHPLLTIGLIFGGLGALLAAIQAMGPAGTIDHWPLLAAYGWRNYFLYIPLPFVIGQVLRQSDLQRLIRLTLLLSVPVAALVVLQFRSSPDAPINVGFGANPDEQFHGLTVDLDHTRPMGLFTSDVGQKEFTASALAMLLALWIAPAARSFVRRWQLLAATCAVLACLAVSGSRGAMLQSGIVILAGAASALLVRRSGTALRAAILPALIALVAIVLFPVVFPEAYATFMNRWTSAAATEAASFHWGIFGRALYGFVDFIGLMGDAPAIGYGLGLAGNASLALGITIPGFAGWAESDWARHIVDLGPIAGVLFILYRIALVGWLGAVCIRGAQRTQSALPVLLFAFVGTEMLVGQITGHGTVNGYGWFFTGLCLVAARAAPEPLGAQQPSPATAPATPRFANLLR